MGVSPFIEMQKDLSGAKRKEFTSGRGISSLHAARHNRQHESQESAPAMQVGSFPYRNQHSAVVA
jgi:hypothetical protein